MLAILLGCSVYGYSQSTYVVEDGITYTRVLTHDEFVSINGYIIGESTSGGGKLSSVRNLKCESGSGGCTGITMTITNGTITAITLPVQCDSSGDCITAPITDKFPYYSSENSIIIFR